MESSKEFCEKRQRMRTFIIHGISFEIPDLTRNLFHYASIKNEQT